MHRPRKRFGQHFLKDPQIIENLVGSLNFNSEDKVVEIGPGLGALTYPLLGKLKHLVVIEIDRDLQKHWQEENLPNLEIQGQDALTVNYSQWGRGLHLVGNLPYNIATTLLFHLLQYKDYIQDMCFMVQKEVAERLCANTGSKDYGRLSIMMQYYCSISKLFDVPAGAFAPAPKVESTVISLKPYSPTPYPFVSKENLSKVVAKAFAMRRKTIANNLKEWLSADNLNNFGFNSRARPQELSVADFVHLTQILEKSSII